MIAATFAFLVRHATLVLAAGVLLGLIVPAFASLFRPALPAAVWGMLFLAMVRVDWNQIAGHLAKPATVCLATAWLLIASPVLASLAAKAFDIPPGLAAALVLFAVSPPLITTPALAMLLGLDAALALVVVGAATLLAPIAVPAVGFHLLEQSIGIDGFAMLQRLALFVGSSVIAAWLVRRVFGRARLVAARGAIDGSVVTLLAVFAVGIMDGVAARLLADPAHVLGVVALVFLVYAGLQVAGALAFVWTGRRTMLTLGFATANRNFALTVALLPETAPSDLFLFFVVMQLPIYLFPMVLKPIYAKVLAGHGREGAT